jgi:hypothetical protein
MKAFNSMLLFKEISGIRKSWNTEIGIRNIQIFDLLSFQLSWKEVLFSPWV